MNVPHEFAHLVEYRDGGYFLLPAAWSAAVRENRVGEIFEPGNEVTLDGLEEKDIKFIVFQQGTIGMWSVDAFRITAQGQIYDGYYPVPVRLSEVSPPVAAEMQLLSDLLNERSQSTALQAHISVDWQREGALVELVRTGSTGHFTVTNSDAEGVELRLEFAR